MIQISRRAALRRLEQVARTPTAPFHEQRVLEVVRSLVTGWGLRWDVDAYGNARVVYENPPSGPAADAMTSAPFVVVAHTDHPGFEIVGPDDRGRTEALWMGGVRPPHFRDARVSVFPSAPDAAPTAAVVDEVKLDDEKRVERLWLRVDGDPPAPGAFGAFALPPFAHDRDTKTASGRALDDLAGVAAMLSALEALVRSQPEGVLWLLFTRAEEVGFVGAGAACDEGYLPPGARLLSLETSAELPGVSQGRGPVIRVGDRASVYDTTTVAALDAVAADLAKRTRKRFHFQRALMSGGACEATLFARRGFATAGLALPLRGYHNMGPVHRGRGAVVPESIHTDDYIGMARLVAHIAVHGYEKVEEVRTGADPLGKRLEKTAARWRKKLKETARGGGRGSRVEGRGTRVEG